MDHSSLYGHQNVACKIRYIKQFLYKVFGKEKLRDVLQEREVTSLNYFKEYFNYIDQFFQCILPYLVLSQFISVYFGLSWSIFDHLGLSRIILDYLVLCQTISDYISLSWSISVYLCLSRTISVYLGLSRTIPDYLGLSLAIYVNYQVSECK